MRRESLLYLVPSSTEHIIYDIFVLTPLHFIRKNDLDIALRVCSLPISFEYDSFDKMTVQGWLSV